MDTDTGGELGWLLVSCARRQDAPVTELTLCSSTESDPRVTTYRLASWEHSLGLA